MDINRYNDTEIREEIIERLTTNDRLMSAVEIATEIPDVSTQKIIAVLKRMERDNQIKVYRVNGQGIVYSHENYINEAEVKKINTIYGYLRYKNYNYIIAHTISFSTHKYNAVCGEDNKTKAILKALKYHYKNKLDYVVIENFRD